MSSVRSGDDVIAILCADLHLTETPPVARSAEPDWFAAQARPLKQLKDLAEKHDAVVVCSGDVFDRWRSSPAVINFAIENLPTMHAVPGQHDLPYHNYDDIRRSAYWTLVEAGKIINLEPGKSKPIGEGHGIIATGFPWDFPIEPCERKWGVGIQLAVIHAYVWMKGCSYPGASEESKLGAYQRQLKGYDAAVFGDNHIAFQAEAGDCQVLNCGCLIPRTIDEKKRPSTVGLLYGDGRIDIHTLDVSEDKWEVPGQGETPEVDLHMEEFLEGLNSLDNVSLDFRKAIEQYISNTDNNVEGGVKKVLLEALDG